MNRRVLVAVIVVVNVASTFAAKGAAPSFSFAGVPVAPGLTVRANVSLSAQEKSLAAQGGNPVPQRGVAVLITPANFDPQKTWLVLISLATRDGRRQNRDDLVEFYRRRGVAGGSGVVFWAGWPPGRRRPEG